MHYYGLAVVEKDATLKFTELKGKKSCHTGVGKTVGWKIPVGYLLYNKDMAFTKDQYKSAADFFGESCAPGRLNYWLYHCAAVTRRADSAFLKKIPSRGEGGGVGGKQKQTFF